MQQGALLWVYEGMTQYLGNVLAARSGLNRRRSTATSSPPPPPTSTTSPAASGASTEDTAIAASILRGGNPTWANWKRGQDYYQEGELLWLDADTLIRKLTDNKKSLTDFLHIFLAKGGNTGPLIVTYNREELIADLNQVVKYDWAGFLHDRVDNINPHADLAGIEQGGYKLVYIDHPTPSARSRRSGTPLAQSTSGTPSASASQHDGAISDVRWNGPADKASLAPGMKIIAVNGGTFSGDALTSAIKNAKGKTEPIHLILESENSSPSPTSTTTTASATPPRPRRRHPGLPRRHHHPSHHPREGAGRASQRVSPQAAFS